MPETEPESVPKPETDVSGRVAAAGASAEKALQETGLSKEQIAQLKQENEQLKTFTSGVLSYTSKDETGKPTGWDLNKIIKDSVEDSGKADRIMEILNGATPPPQNQPTPPPNDPAVDFERMKKDPVGFLKEHTAKVIEAVKADLAKEMAPIRQDISGYKIRDMVAEVRGAHQDFDQHSKEIIDIARNRPPKNARDLEAIYFEVLGRKGVTANSQGVEAPRGNLARSAGGASKAGKADKTYAQEVFDRMMHAGVPVDKRSGSLNALFGKDHLLPLEGE